VPTAKKLPSGSWRVRVSVKADGKFTTKSFTAATKPDVERMAARFVGGLDKHHARSALTFSEAAEEYLRDREAVLSPSTLRAYKAITKNDCALLDPLRVDRLTNADIQRQANRLSANHSPKTVRNVMTLIGAILSVYAPDLRPDPDLPAKRKTDIAIPSDAQLRALLSEADTNLRTAVMLAASLGLRRGEICALTWADCDLQNKIVKVNKDMVQDPTGRWVTKAPKTYASARVLDIPDGCAAYLAVIRPKDAAPSARIVPVTPGTITDTFKNCRRRAGVSCRFHDLRHYYASLMLAIGVPDKYAMERMGHATPHMLRTVYQHIRAEKQAEISRSISAALDTALPCAADLLPAAAQSAQPGKKSGGRRGSAADASPAAPSGK